MTDNSELFVLYKQVPGGGEIWLMLGLETTDSDYKDILSISECLAAEGHKVKVLHAVHYKDPLYKVVFGELIGTRYYRKCPDLLVDGEYVEYVAQLKKEKQSQVWGFIMEYLYDRYIN